jgi:DNA-binding beta-propeller fold protein YncE
MSRMGWGAGKTCEPTAITFDPTSSLLFMTDIANHRVCKLTQEGKYVSSIGKPGSEDGGLVVPCGIAVSPDGTLAIVADSNNHRIQLFNSHSGEFVRAQVVLQGRSKYRKEVSCPTGIVFDKSGELNIY